MHGPLRPTYALLANYMAKCQMSSGLYGPILIFLFLVDSLIFVLVSVLSTLFYLYQLVHTLFCLFCVLLSGSVSSSSVE